MNVILEGPDAAGKTTLAEKLGAERGMRCIHSTAKTRNDFAYHIDLLDFNDEAVMDRFHVGEMIFPEIYSRPGKLTESEYEAINRRIEDNNDIFIIFFTSDMSILEERLIARGELEYLDEIAQQNEMFKARGEEWEARGYKNFYLCDIAKPDAYAQLYSWVDEHIGKETVNTAYRKLARNIIEHGEPMDSQNLRGHTLELTNYMMKIDDVDEECVSLASGHTDFGYIAAELLWYWSSRNDLEFIGKFAKMWEKVSDDGVTANSAYGYIIHEKHGFDQLEKVIELLKHDPNSRRAVININVPNERVIETKDEPCTIALIYQIRHGKLDATTVMRSNDARFGFLPDIGAFISFQKIIAARLGIEPGVYTHFAASIHFYDKDFKFAKDVAYGTLEKCDEKFDVKKLYAHREELVKWVDEEFDSREGFKAELECLGIISKRRK